MPGITGVVRSEVVRDDQQQFWERLRHTTQARIGLGHAGDSLPTARMLELRAAHAAARDAVTVPLDVEQLMGDLAGKGFDRVRLVTSRAGDRDEYVRRPDRGRLPGDLSGLGPEPRMDGGARPDVAVVVADGLSPAAVQQHAPAMLRALGDAMPAGTAWAPPVVAINARVALGDHLGYALGARTVVVLVGERPGLSVADSLGIYLTYEPRPGRADSERNCVSNIHPPEGLGYRQAAEIVARLIEGARELGRSGIELKDTSTSVLPAGGLTGELGNG